MNDTTRANFHQTLKGCIPEVDNSSPLNTITGPPIEENDLDDYDDRSNNVDRANEFATFDPPVVSPRGKFFIEKGPYQLCFWNT